MTRIEDVLDISELNQLINDGYVRAQNHPDNFSYQIYNYTHKAVGIEWTPTLRECRGLITKGFEVIARPFAKFFNSTEPESSWLAQTPGDTPTIAMDKMDGSLGIAYLAPDGLPAIATRGSFASEQAIHATKVLREKYPHYRVDPDYTDLFEIVYAENRIVLDYGDTDDLVYLGFRDIAGGTLVPASPNGAELFAPGPVAETLSMGTLADALALGERENKEGMVLYVGHNEEFRLVKIKQADYVALHRIVTGLNERVVWEECKAGRLAKLTANLPAEHADWVRSIAMDLNYAVGSITGLAVNSAASKKHEFGKDKRSFALWAKDQPHSAALFAAYDGNIAKLMDYAWKQVRPEARKPRALVAEEA